MNTSNNNLKDFLLEKLRGAIDWILNHLKIVLPVVLVVCGLITIIVAVSAGGRKTEEVAVPQAESIENELKNSISVPTVELQEDAVPELTALMTDYYKAVENGDVETISKMNNLIDETEEIMISENSKYIDKIENIKVYSKAGPVEGSYLAYVYSEVKFVDRDERIPGMQAFYVCTDDNGTLYINDGEEKESVINYIREVSLQDDVVDLNNKVAVAYNDLMAEDTEFGTYLADVVSQIDTSVGEILAQAAGSEQVEAEAAEEETTAPATVTLVTKVKTTDVVNVRSSDSETADKLGKAQAGQEFELVEKKGNGWSHIKYEGKDAYIKTDYLEDAETEVVPAAQLAETETANETAPTENETNEAAVADTQTNQTTTETTNTAKTDTTKKEETKKEETKKEAESADGVKTNGTVVAQSSVRIRSEASENGEKLATVYAGEKLDLVETMSNGWTKIKYKGKIAYVKSEYVQ